MEGRAGGPSGHSTGTHSVESLSEGSGVFQNPPNTLFPRSSQGQVWDSKEAEIVAAPGSPSSHRTLRDTKSWTPIWLRPLEEYLTRSSEAGLLGPSSGECASKGQGEGPSLPGFGSSPTHTDLQNSVSGQKKRRGKHPLPPRAFPNQTRPPSSLAPREMRKARLCSKNQPYANSCLSLTWEPKGSFVSRSSAEGRCTRLLFGKRCIWSGLRSRGCRGEDTARPTPLPGCRGPDAGPAGLQLARIFRPLGKAPGTPPCWEGCPVR